MPISSEMRHKGRVTELLISSSRNPWGTYAQNLDAEIPTQLLSEVLSTWKFWEVSTGISCFISLGVHF